MFNCIFDKCPKNSEECHLWWEMPWENTESGEVRTRKGCILSQEFSLPIIQAIVRAAHTSSEESSKVNNNLLNGLVDIANIMVKEIRTQAAIENDEDKHKTAEISS
jgi:hypothetical protein